MTKAEYRDYLSSPSWQSRRKEFLTIYGFECAKCKIPRWLAVIAYDQDLHVHHLSYKHLGNEKDEDLSALCRRCHEIETFGRSSLRPPWSEECNSCGSPCYDPYGTGECINCLGLEYCDARVSMYYENLLRSMMCFLGTDTVLNAMAKIEKQEASDGPWRFE